MIADLHLSTCDVLPKLACWCQLLTVRNFERKKVFPNDQKLDPCYLYCFTVKNARAANERSQNVNPVFEPFTIKFILVGNSKICAIVGTTFRTIQSCYLSCYLTI